MAVGPVDIEFVLRGDVDAQLRRVSQTVAGESKALQDQVAKFGEAFRESFDKSSDSIAGMQEKLRALKAIYAELSEEGRNSEFGRILTEQIVGLENSIKRAEGQNRSFMDSIKGLPGPVGAAASEMEMMTKAALRFIATPIGAVIAAIVVALKALTTWFKSSEEGEFQSTRPREARLYKCNWLIYNNIEVVSREDVFFLTCQRTIPYHILNKDLIINECERPGIPNGIICSRNSIPIKVLPCRNFG